jgi:hypothetical protein
VKGTIMIRSRKSITATFLSAFALAFALAISLPSSSAVYAANPNCAYDWLCLGGGLNIYAPSSSEAPSCGSDTYQLKFTATMCGDGPYPNLISASKYGSTTVVPMVHTGSGNYIGYTGCAADPGFSTTWTITSGGGASFSVGCIEIVCCVE